MKANFEVITNQPRKIKLTAVCPNGTQALVTYAMFSNMTKEEREFKYKSLIEYCKQDTWAMVVILDKIRELVKE